MRSVSLSEYLERPGEVYFVILNLTNGDGKMISHNAYWISPDNDFTSLKDLPEAIVGIKVMDSYIADNEMKWTFEISNKSDRIAFFINPQVLAGEEEVIPAFWTVNYFTLAPGETITVNTGCPPEVLKGRKPVIKIEGWNVKETLLIL